jgi:hypothetical protein
MLFSGSKAHAGTATEGCTFIYFVSTRCTGILTGFGINSKHFHYEARTVHSTMRLYMDTANWTDDDVVRYLESNTFEIFAKMKVLIGLEMFVMMDCMSKGLLNNAVLCLPPSKNI